jgi:hypothetical protein
MSPIISKAYGPVSRNDSGITTIQFNNDLTIDQEIAIDVVETALKLDPSGKALLMMFPGTQNEWTLPAQQVFAKAKGVKKVAIIFQDKTMEKLTKILFRVAKTIKSDYRMNSFPSRWDAEDWLLNGK